LNTISFTAQPPIAGAGNNIIVFFYLSFFGGDGCLAAILPLSIDSQKKFLIAHFPHRKHSNLFHIFRPTIKIQNISQNCRMTRFSPWRI
jgi:hypothetical protein